MGGQVGRRQHHQHLDCLLWEGPRRTPSEGSVMPLRDVEKIALEVYDKFGLWTCCIVTGLLRGRTYSKCPT